MEIILDLNDPPAADLVQRRPVPCVACRAKKRRCNFGRPICIRCIRDGEPECVYAVSIVKGRPRTVILQQKVHDLEEQVVSLQSAIDAAGRDSLKPTSKPRYPRIAVLPVRHVGALEEAGHVPRRQYSLVSSNPWQFQAGFDPLMSSWYTTNEPPPSGVIANLVKIFAQKEHHHTHDPRPIEFYDSLYDPDSTSGPHPALRNAVFLLACGYSHGPLSQLEPMLLRRTVYYLEQSLATADRLLDYIEAYTLLSIYQAFKGRFQQSLRNISAAMAFAFACGLHAIRPPEWHPIGSPSLLPRPIHRFEIRRRIRIWWMIFALNRFGSAAVNIDKDYDDGRIETVWELSPEPIGGSPSLKETNFSTVSSLFVLGNGAAYVYNDTANAIRSKCAAIIERAARISIETTSSMLHCCSNIPLQAFSLAIFYSAKKRSTFLGQIRRAGPSHSECYQFTSLSFRRASFRG
ncbi:hypothetical protein BOTBODRAFT_477031 [Botryobasidium botryosum FD-172 SS1]|uniref:Zn(2)-C6 fungal-type domain-containing protein n=1 Tax=Botryobasidium botryosum (strain FD-172 SS1) TaxID=930990 RepID=A0A067N520_BOTB1|nr:hypothetical protein BOTBODRAFT_477031 [Botryobasidium botryosum FD-172 SS1]